MKYLKSFNHLNESSENEPLWETVTMNDYLRREEVHGKDEDFDDIDKDKIRKGIRYGGHDYSMRGFSSIEIDITNDDNGDGCKRFVEYVKKSPDEWFYVKEFYYFWHRGERPVVGDKRLIDHKRIRNQFMSLISSVIL